VNLALLDRARELGARESGLAVVVTIRNDGSAQASVVNAGILSHPITAEPVVGFVARGDAKKLAYLRLRPRATVVFRSGWEWVTVEGATELVGPEDLHAGIRPDAVARCLRQIYAAAVGGSVDDWAELDDVFAVERHTAVLIRPRRIYANPAGP
jgi:hypothetical protein